MKTDYRTIKVEITQGVAILRLNNPPVNQLSKPFVEEMRDALISAYGDNEVKAVILTGTEKNFIAGADITEMQKVKDKDSIFPLVMENNRFLNSFEQGPKPVIAAHQWKLPWWRFGNRHGLSLSNCSKRNTGGTARGSDRFNSWSWGNTKTSPTGGTS